MFLIGGNDGHILNKVEMLDFSITDPSWTITSHMKIKRDELAVTVGPDGMIYAIGGYGGQDRQCLASAERYNVSTDTWEKIGDLKQPRRALAAVALPDGVYAIGGYNGKKYISSVEKYDEGKN